MGDKEKAKKEKQFRETCSMSDKMGFRRTRFSQPYVKKLADVDDSRYSNNINSKVDVHAYNNTKNRNIEDYVTKH